MKVVLRKDVEKLGEAGSVKNVADGFARNYLIPKGLAVIATSGELKVVAENQKVKERKIARQEQELQELSDRIQGQRLIFETRTGTSGRLFGSVTSGDIAERLSATVGHDIDRRKIAIEEPIRTVGEHPVHVLLVGRLRPEITVVVKGLIDDSTEEPAGESEPQIETEDS
jgi:large subunit ribosomal protein L9